MGKMSKAKQVVFFVMAIPDTLEMLTSKEPHLGIAVSGHRKSGTKTTGALILDRS